MGYLAGFDSGSSSIKGTLLDAETGRAVSSFTSPATELKIDSPHPGWAEQNPETWWEHFCIVSRAILQNVNPADVMPYLRHMTHVDLPMFLRMLRAAGDHSAWDFLPEVSVPTLVVASEKDTFTPAYLAREMARAIPKATLEEVSGASHVLPIERPAFVNDRILRFLRESGVL